MIRHVAVETNFFGFDIDRCTIGANGYQRSLSLKFIEFKREIAAMIKTRFNSRALECDSRKPTVSANLERRHVATNHNLFNRSSRSRVTTSCERSRTPFVNLWEFASTSREVSAARISRSRYKKSNNSTMRIIKLQQTSWRFRAASEAKNSAYIINSRIDERQQADDRVIVRLAGDLRFHDRAFNRMTVSFSNGTTLWANRHPLGCSSLPDMSGRVSQLWLDRCDTPKCILLTRFFITRNASDSWSLSITRGK